MNSFMHAVFLTSILCAWFDETIAADSPCGDWEPYKDEKCFKIFDNVGFQSYEDAKKTCQQQENSCSLVSIRSLEEQTFFTDFLFKTHKVVDTIWIGAKNSSNRFKWADDSELSFTNWAAESPSNKIGNDCVQIEPEGSSLGKWIDEPCNKKNIVVCQKMQTWSLSRLQKTLLDSRKDLQDSLEDVRKHLNKHQTAINNLEHNPIPIGFIYVQLPGQVEPKTFWPTVGWKDVTSDYAGLFFRAEGGSSAAFDDIQEANSPRLVHVKRNLNQCVDDIYPSANDVPSLPIVTGKDSGGFHCLEFTVSGGEVRPRNKAVRIWKRTN